MDSCVLLFFQGTVFMFLSLLCSPILGLLKMQTLSGEGCVTVE